MRLGQIADVNEIPDAAAVGGRIVGSEHIDLGALPGGRFDGDLQQMGRADGRKADAASGSAPATLK